MENEKVDERLQVLHARIPEEINLRIDAAVARKRRETGRRVRRTELIIAWLETCLEADEAMGNPGEVAQ